MHHQVQFMVIQSYFQKKSSFPTNTYSLTKKFNEDCH